MPIVPGVAPVPDQYRRSLGKNQTTNREVLGLKGKLWLLNCCSCELWPRTEKAGTLFVVPVVEPKRA